MTHGDNSTIPTSALHPIDALRIAVENNDTSMVQSLLAAGGQPRPFEFLNAVEQASYPILELMLQHGYDPNQAWRCDYPPPLAYVTPLQMVFCSLEKS